ILDTSKNKLLVLNPLIKTAFALNIGDANTGPENEATEIFDWIEKIKNTTGQQAHSIGSRDIDGVEAKGFVLSEQGMEYTVGEEDIVALLRWYSGKSDGKFPRALDGWMNFAKVAKQDKELMGIMVRAGRATAFLTSLGGKNYGYAGAGARLGEGQKIVFWYRV